jgi:hypothetical protein
LEHFYVEALNNETIDVEDLLGSVFSTGITLNVADVNYIHFHLKKGNKSDTYLSFQIGNDSVQGEAA